MTPEQITDLQFANARLTADVLVLQAHLKSAIARAEFWQAMATVERRNLQAWRQAAIDGGKQ